MIYGLKGTLIDGRKVRGRHLILVEDYAGVVHGVWVSLRTVESLGSKMREVQLEVRQVTDTAGRTEMFGFVSRIDADFFVSLVGVPRVGPYLAMTIMALMAEVELVDLLNSTRWLERMVAVKGIGDATAKSIKQHYVGSTYLRQ